VGPHWIFEFDTRCQQVIHSAKLLEDIAPKGLSERFLAGDLGVLRRQKFRFMY
jgi:hypothetical protein